MAILYALMEKIWDHAAGSLVATEAGMVVTDVHGLPLDFSHGARLEVNKGVVCASRAFHSMLVDGIKEMGFGAEGSTAGA